MTSKVSRDMLYNALKNILQDTQDHDRDCLDVVELQIGLNNYDINKDKRFYGSVLLNHIAVPQLNVCIFGDQQHCDEAKTLGIQCLDVEDLKMISKNPKLVKKIARNYDAFLASESLIKQIPISLGSGLTHAGKYLIPLSHKESMRAKITILATKKTQVKNIECLSVNVGHIGMLVEDLIQNLNISINFLVSLLKENWQNVRSLYVKSSMGLPQRIY
ncbi:large ribosomal subunit protein uL1 [Drosophila kikkawai]|uniref:Large ribosomal subunit protein uL1 n=1 Tax=Drosophila kikkawai TaxID=30033 RepID=A0A6P4JLR4_DROKI|nr:60S ribosomal protein L10a-2 [Drosophila kikkawai]